MENYIDELIEIGMGNVIDSSIDKYIVEDEIYKTTLDKAGNILEKLRQNLTVENQELFEEYMECVMSANGRACAIAYLVGAKNTIKFMK